ncbi:MAG: acyl-CoA thioesterase [Mycobacterium sp.]|jgi:acyl-CoA thioesterase-2|nr:acyl-CoA thioesterase [Mycobacterium sp.]
MTSGINQVLALFDLEQDSDGSFLGNQQDSPNHHIIGSVVAAQALMAASRTTSGRPPHSAHMYFLRLGDARHQVRYQVTSLRDGGTFSTRRVTATQNDAVLFEALASYSSGSGEPVEYRQQAPDAPDPETLVSVSEQVAPYGDEGGWWKQQRPFDMRYVDGMPRIWDPDQPPRPEVRLWLHAEGTVPDDLVVNSCLLAYISALTLLEGAMTVVGATPSGPRLSALVDHSVWFHHPADFSDWLLYDQRLPSLIGGRGKSTGTIYNRTGELVCMATQEGYFPPGRAARC